MRYDILVRRENGRTLYTLDDGYDYPGLLAAWRRGDIVGTRFKWGTPARGTVLLEHDGRRFVLKTDTLSYDNWDARFRLRLYGTPYFPIMRKVVKAIAAGCTRLQQMYLVEETAARDPKTGAVSVTATLLLEYLPGEALLDSPEKNSLRLRIPDVLRELHRHKLTQTDPNEGNFVVAEDGGLKVIDLHFFSKPFILVWPRAVIAIVDKSDIPFPLDSMFQRAVVHVVRAKLFLLRWIHGIRGGGYKNR